MTNWKLLDIFYWKLLLRVIIVSIQSQTLTSLNSN